jgi:dienelactone hydrolase
MIRAIVPHPRRRLGRAITRLALGLALTSYAIIVRAEAPRVLPEGKLPDDSRLGALKDLNGYFPFTVSASPEAWKERAEYVRRQLLVATGLWPMPTKTPANAVIHGRVDRDGYTVEKVYLESFPGFCVTGSLYRPKGKSGKLPGVLCPHGHFPNGRFYETPRKEVREQFVSGAERFDVGGRYPLQARCVQLARMGCVVFMWDMVGYADSVQISEAVAHGFKVRRPQMETPTGWGFFSPQAELHLQSIMGLQTYNSLRVLDWFSELPDVDSKRIGVTGESGGGTQTMLIGALDSRPAVLFPAVMVSTAMQGGCTCENCDYLRIGTGNIEFAAMASPRPLGMTAADDWTKELATKGLPELQRHYAMLGVPKLVMAKPLLQFPHNYNYVSRAVMYGWINDHLKLGLEKPIVEEDFKPLSIAEMSVWDADHPKPKGGEEFECGLLRWVTEDSVRQIAALMPTDEKSLAEFRRIVGGAFDVIAGLAGTEHRGGGGPNVRLPSLAIMQTRTSDERPEYQLITGLIHSDKGQLPTVLLKPKSYRKQLVIWIDGEGKADLFDGANVRPAAKRLLDAGVEVVGVDLLYQGEFLADGKSLTTTRRVENSRDYAGFTLAYNRPLFAERVHDLLTVIAAMRFGADSPERVFLIGTAGAGPIAAAARAQAGSAVDRLAIDTGHFRFANLTSIDDPDFLPGAVKYGDLPAMLALSAPHDLWITGEPSNRMELPQAAYRAAGAENRCTIDAGPADGAESRAVEWLLH